MSFIHVIERARERYGIDLSVDDVLAVREQIVNGRSVLLERQDAEREMHLVKAGDVAMKAVFDHATGHVVTVLPRHARNRRPGLRKLKGVRR